MTRRLTVEWPDPEAFEARGGAPIRLLAVSDAPDPAGSPSNRKGADTQQEHADAAQRERMREALRQGEEARRGDEASPDGREREEATETAEQRERRLANQAWLRRIPDDPGGLLRAKLRLEHERRQREGID